MKPIKQEIIEILRNCVEFNGGIKASFSDTGFGKWAKKELEETEIKGLELLANKILSIIIKRMPKEKETQWKLKEKEEYNILEIRKILDDLCFNAGFNQALDTIIKSLNQ